MSKKLSQPTTQSKSKEGSCYVNVFYHTKFIHIYKFILRSSEWRLGSQSLAFSDSPSTYKDNCKLKGRHWFVCTNQWKRRKDRNWACFGMTTVTCKTKSKNSYFYFDTDTSLHWIHKEYTADNCLIWPVSSTTTSFL